MAHTKKPSIADAMKTRTCVNNAQQKPDVSNISITLEKRKYFKQIPITNKNNQPTFKINFPIAISIENVNDALHEGVLLELRQRHKLVNAESPRIVQI